MSKKISLDNVNFGNKKGSVPKKPSNTTKADTKSKGLNQDKAQNLYKSKKTQTSSSDYQPMGIIALVISILGFITDAILAPVAIILAIISLVQFRKSKQKGIWMPIVALCLSAIQIIMVVIVIFLMILAAIFTVG